MNATALDRLKLLADELTTEVDPRWKDDWEKGQDAGTMFAGEKLAKLFAELTPQEDPPTPFSDEIMDVHEHVDRDLRWLSPRARHQSNRTAAPSHGGTQAHP
ncbi:hypothetical protein ACX80Z_15385 [Arthrobacter sp. TMT4-20]